MTLATEQRSEREQEDAPWNYDDEKWRWSMPAPVAHDVWRHDIARLSERFESCGGRVSYDVRHRR